MKKFCAILFSFVLVLMLALPVAAEDAAGESDSLFDTAPALTAPAGYVVTSTPTSSCTRKTARPSSPPPA